MWLLKWMVWIASKTFNFPDSIQNFKFSKISKLSFSIEFSVESIKSLTVKQLFKIENSSRAKIWFSDGHFGAKNFKVSKIFQKLAILMKFSYFLWNFWNADSSIRNDIFSPPQIATGRLSIIRLVFKFIQEVRFIHKMSEKYLKILKVGENVRQRILEMVERIRKLFQHLEVGEMPEKYSKILEEGRNVRKKINFLAF